MEERNRKRTDGRGVRNGAGGKEFRNETGLNEDSEWNKWNVEMRTRVLGREESRREQMKWRIRDGAGKEIIEKIRKKTHDLGVLSGKSLVVFHGANNSSRSGTECGIKNVLSAFFSFFLKVLFIYRAVFSFLFFLFFGFFIFFLFSFSLRFFITNFINENILVHGIGGG